MKAKKKIISFLLAGLAATQSISCTSSKEEILKSERIMEENIKEEDTQEEYKDLSSLTDQQEQDTVTEEVIETLEDIIVSYSEEDISLSMEGRESVENLFAIENENLETSYFNITEDKVERQFVEFANQEGVTEHMYHDLYDADTNTILFDEAVDVIYKNSQESIYIKVSEDEQGEDIKQICTGMSKEDIAYILSLFKDYYPEMKSKYPAIDAKEIACKLQGGSLYYTSSYIFLRAKTTYKYIVYFDSEQNIYTFDPTNSTSIHEFFHFICASCDCAFNPSMYHAEGVNIIAPEYSFNDVGFEDYAKKDLKGFAYGFIEEASAERTMFSYLGEMPSDCFDYQKVVDNIEFVLSLDENYPLDNYIDASLSHDPIQFIQEFPVGDANTKENFTDNVRMLVVYDSLLHYGDVNKKYIDATLANCTQEEQDQRISHLILYSQSQLTKLFFTNLIVLNETHPDKKDLSYYAYLMDIFYGKMQQTNEILSEIWDLPESCKVNEAYDESFYQMKEMYINYICSYYQEETCRKILEEATKDEVGLPFVEEYPSYVSEDHKRFYNYLKNGLISIDLSIPRKILCFEK